jgi:hypothetical protein
VGKGLAVVVGSALIGFVVGPADGQQVVWIRAQVLEASDPDGLGPVPPPLAQQPPKASQEGESRSAPRPRRERRPWTEGPQAPKPPETGIDEDYPAPVLDRIRRLFRYRDYQTLVRLRGQSALGVKQTFVIPGKGSLDVTPERMRDRWVQLRVVLRQGGRVGLDAGVVAPPGVASIFGSPTPGDRAMIVIVWANPEPSPQR